MRSRPRSRTRTWSIQWDLPVEDATIEGWFPNPYRDFEEIFAVTARPASWVHDDVELTFHLCYGDSKFGASPFMGDPPDEEAAARGGRHVYPRDASVIVAVSNGLSRHVPRRIDAIQAATVTTWNRLAHWQPLANLAIEPETEFYLGLVHAEDGAAGARYRAALASKFLPNFGLSTECGLGGTRRNNWIRWRRRGRRTVRNQGGGAGLTHARRTRADAEGKRARG